METTNQNFFVKEKIPEFWADWLFPKHFIHDRSVALYSFAFPSISQSSQAVVHGLSKD